MSSITSAQHFTARPSPFRAQAEGRARIWGRQPAKPAGRGHLYTYGYDVVGRPSSLTYPDGHTRTQVYDDLGRITSRCYEYSGPTTRCYTASYDAVGNPVTMSDPDGADTLTYDALDRLTKVTRVASGVTAVETYAYNALGALKVNAGVVLDDQRPKLAGGGTADAAVPANVGGQPVTLDAGGRVTSLRGTTFTWTKDGTLREADDPIPAVPETYGVDARARRYSRMLGGAVQEYYVYEGMDRVAVVGPNGSGVVGPLLESYLFDGIDHPLRIARPGATTNYYYYEIDLAGNVRGLRASGGASLGGYRYTAFGQTVEDTSLVNQPLRWKGRWFSSVAGGTYDVRARQWSPELGVFLTIDEFEEHDNASSLWGWPNQNPIRFGDPEGRGKFCFPLNPFVTICISWPDPPLSPAPSPAPSPSPAAGPCDGGAAPDTKKWYCDASCNVEGTEPQCTGRVTGSASGGNENDTCREAKRDATQKAPKGCYARHCQCSCEQR
jgi:RHS repeat-associated protein